MARSKGDRVFFFGDEQAIDVLIPEIQFKHTQAQMFAVCGKNLALHKITTADETFARCEKADGYVIVVDLKKTQEENNALIRKALNKIRELGFSGWTNIIGINAGVDAKTDLLEYYSYLNTRTSEIEKSANKSYRQIMDNIEVNKRTPKFYRQHSEEEIAKKEMLIGKLDAYIKSVESKKKDNGKTNYQYGFWIFTKSQGLNRKVNCFYAQKLKELLQDERNSIQDVFDNPNVFRDEIIAELKLKERWNFFNAGMNSNTLQDIFDEAENYLHPKPGYSTL